MPRARRDRVKDSRAVVLLAARVPESFRQRLALRYEILGPLAAPFPESVAALPRSDAERVRIVITMGTVKSSRAALAHLPTLGLVCCMGSGFEGVDLATTRERGCRRHGAAESDCESDHNLTQHHILRRNALHPPYFENRVQPDAWKACPGDARSVLSL